MSFGVGDSARALQHCNSVIDFSVATYFGGNSQLLVYAFHCVSGFCLVLHASLFAFW